MTLEQLLKDGARAMGETRYEDAVEIYSEACQMANLEQGKDDPDLMFLYGKALFENAVQSSDVLGGVGKGKEEEGEKGEVKGEGEGEGETAKSGGDGQFQFSSRLAEEEGEEEEEEEEEAAQKAASDSDSDEEVEAPADGDEPEQGDFEIAWEILDLTRILYEEQLAGVAPVAEPYEAHAADNPDFVARYGRLSDVYMLMGDISLETENFPQAAEDYEKANGMLERAFAACSGRRHEALFKLSLAHEFVGSDESVQRAVSCMEALLALVEQRDGAGGAAGADGASLVHEVRSRLADLRTLQQQRAAEKDQLVALLKGVTAAATAAATDAAHPGPVTDLTGLVKSRKKKSKPGRVGKR